METTMPLNYPQAGPSDVPSYQMSAIPFVTSSVQGEVGGTPLLLRFPSVTRFMVVTNFSGHVMRIGFTSNGISGSGGVSGSKGESTADRSNYFILSGNQSTPRMEIRCKEMFFMRDTSKDTGGSGDCAFSVFAGLTPVAYQQFPTLTGSNGYDGVG